MSIQLSVVVCTFNRARLLEKALSSLAAQNLGQDIYEVIIVDNNSTDETEKVGTFFAKNYRNFYLLKETRQGISYSRNRGWRSARGRFVAFLDDDAKAAPDWCYRILQAFAKIVPSPVAVGGAIHPWYETTPPDWFSDDLEIRSWGEQSGFLRPPVSRFGFAGSNMAFPRSILEGCGGFDCRLGPKGTKMRFGEDSELFFRIHEMTPRFWYDPGIRVYHWVPIRNMRISYRLRRSFQTGRAGARIHGHGFFSLGHLRAMLILLYVGFKIPIRILCANGNRSGAAVKALQDVATRLGFVLECWTLDKAD